MLTLNSLTTQFTRVFTIITRKTLVESSTCWTDGFP